MLLFDKRAGALRLCQKAERVSPGKLSFRLQPPTLKTVRSAFVPNEPTSQPSPVCARSDLAGYLARWTRLVDAVEALLHDTADRRTLDRWLS